jgi:hypothetical protein
MRGGGREGGKVEEEGRRVMGGKKEGKKFSRGVTDGGGREEREG